MKLEERQFGGTDIKLSVVGLGTWAIGGGDWRYGWGPQEDRDSIDAIHAALEGGINWIDTAPAYGLGHSEKIVGEALKQTAYKPFIATKCGLFQDKKGEVYSDISQKSIRKEVEASLKRLGVDVIDLYQIHWPKPSQDIEEGFDTLLQLREEGKIRYAGVCNFSLEQLKLISRRELPASLQSPFSLVRQELNYEVIPWCRENNVPVLAYSPLQCGLLTGKVTPEWVEALPPRDWRRENKYFNEPHLSQILRNVEEIKKTIPPMSAAIKWVISRPGVTSAIVGARNVNQVSQILESLAQPSRDIDFKKIGALFAAAS